MILWALSFESDAHLETTQSLETELFYAVYFLIKYAKFDYASILDMTLFDFASFFYIAKNQAETEKKEYDEVRSDAKPN